MNRDQHQNVGKQVFPKGKSTPDHRTPKSFLKNLGVFDLDAAASKENAICERYFDEKMNGLAQNWYGRVWVNPPYSQIDKWIDKAIEEVQVKRNCREVVFLVPSRTCTKWFFKAFRAATSIQFIHGRLDFHGPNMRKEKRANAPFPSVLIILTSHVPVFGPNVSITDREGLPLTK